MVAKKRQSKRVSLSKKYLVQKKVRAHSKKLKKLKKKHPEKFKKSQKDPGVPKTLPFYDAVIAEAKRAQENKLKEIKERQERKKALKEQMSGKGKAPESINEMIQTAEQRGMEFEEKTAESNAQENLTDRSAKAYYREFRKVVEAADVILEVLDARDPLGSRVPQMEAAITCHPGKKLVLVLNKADLVPRDVLENWLKYLRHEHPTVVFKSTTQTQATHLGQTHASTSSKVLRSSEDAMNSAKSLGADVLMQLLKNYCRNKDIKTSITVGVVGLPNVGKSSLINSLKRSKACGVGATPGFTKTLQQVQLDSKVQLVDCPGIVLPGGNLNDASAALRNAVKIEQLDDPITPVQAIYNRADKNQLMIHYKLADFNTLTQFLARLAKRYGKLKKGGIPDQEMAARKVLQDWNTGVIKYYTQPPETNDAQVGASLVTQLGQEFDLDSLAAVEGSLMDTIPNYRPSQVMAVKSLGPVAEVKEQEMEEADEEEMEGDVSDDEEEEMETDDEAENQDAKAEEKVLPKDVNITIGTTPASEGSTVTEKKPRWENPMQEFDPETMSLRKFQKKAMKKRRKEANRNIKRAEDLTNVLASFSGINEKDDNYDFDAFFG